MLVFVSHLGLDNVFERNMKDLVGKQIYLFDAVPHPENITSYEFPVSTHSTHSYNVSSMESSTIIIKFI